MAKARKSYWFDDESFWKELYTFMFPETQLNAGAGEMTRALRLAKPKGKTVLDLCCGPGRCAVPLAKRGFRVTGVDKSKFLLGKARARAREAGVAIEWVRADMRDFVRPDTYDLAISMFTSLGYFDTEDDDITVMRNMFASLRPGGKCVIDVIGKEHVANIFQPTVSSVLPDGSRLVQFHEFIEDMTRIRNEWVLIRKGTATSFPFDLRLYSGLELRDRVESVGFTRVRLYGDLDGSAYGLTSRRLIAVATKPGKTQRR